MNYIKVPAGTKIACISDVHEHGEQFFKLWDKINPSQNMWLVVGGDLYRKGFGAKVAESIIDKMKPLINDGYGYFLRGNNELFVIREARKNNKMTPYLSWCENQPLSVSFEFANNTKLTVVHAGVLPKHTEEDLKNNIEVCYVRDVMDNGEMAPLDYKGNRTSWHKLYDGRYGFIISGHNAQIATGKSLFYSYSCNIDTGIYKNGTLACQIFSQNGREDLIIVKGKAFK